MEIQTKEANKTVKKKLERREKCKEETGIRKERKKVKYV